jgi:hypothetical protein
MIYLRRAEFGGVDVSAIAVHTPHGRARMLLLDLGSSHGPSAAGCARRACPPFIAYLCYLNSFPRNRDGLRSYDLSMIQDVDVSRLALLPGPITSLARPPTRSAWSADAGDSAATLSRSSQTCAVRRFVPQCEPCRAAAGQLPGGKACGSRNLRKTAIL